MLGNWGSIQWGSFVTGWSMPQKYPTAVRRTQDIDSLGPNLHCGEVAQRPLPSIHMLSSPSISQRYSLGRAKEVEDGGSHLCHMERHVNTWPMLQGG